MKKNEQVLGDILKYLFRDEKVRPMYFQTKIEKAWNSSMGATIVQHTESITLKNKILYIRITSPALRQNLLFKKDQILTFANDTIGEKDYISQVILM